MKVILFIFLFFPLACHSATQTAATTSRADVGTAYAACSDGDTLAIPAGSSAWTTTLIVTKAIKIIGAGTNSTIISFGADTPLFQFLTASGVNTNMMLASIQIAPGSFPSSSAWFYVEGCNTNNSYMIITNCFFNGTTSPCPFVIGAIGVMSHCRWILTSGIGCYIYHENWGGNTYSGGSFYDPVVYGSDKFWIIEDCAIYRTGASYAFTDAYRGARYVVRYSALTNSWLEAHGTESGFVRGTRAVESYHNTFYGDGTTDYGHNLRSATLICWSNTIANAGSAGNFEHLAAYRTVFNASPWGGATGDNPIDDNDPTIYATGTATSGGALTLTDTTKSWTPNQWIGYMLTRTSPLYPGFTILTDFRHGHIVSNTGNSITVDVSIGGAFTNQTYAAGNVYKILKVNQSFDQPGAGSDSVEAIYRKNSALTVSGNVASATLSSHGFTTGDYVIEGEMYLGSDLVYAMAQVTVTGPNTYTFPLFHSDVTASAQFEGQTTKIHAYSQIIDPSYEWGNTKEGGVDLNFSNITPTIIRENEHYFNDTPKPGYSPLAYPHPLIAGIGERTWIHGKADKRGKTN